MISKDVSLKIAPVSLLHDPVVGALAMDGELAKADAVLVEVAFKRISTFRILFHAPVVEVQQLTPLAGLLVRNPDAGCLGSEEHHGNALCRDGIVVRVGLGVFANVAAL